MSKQQKSFLTLIVLLTLIFGIPYLWRRHRDSDIREHSKYAFGKIVKQTGSLKNGNHWQYEFYFHDTLYNGFWPTHVDYDVGLGDYVLINFSSSDPGHNKPIYRYKLRQYDPAVIKQVWDTIPASLTIDGRKFPFPMSHRNKIF